MSRRTADPDAERTVIATLLQYPAAGAVAEVGATLKPADFSHASHAHLWRTMQAIDARGAFVDVEAVLAAVVADQGVGKWTPGEVLSLVHMDGVVPESIPGAIARIHEAAKMRRLRDAALATLERIETTADTADEIRVFAEGQVLDAAVREGGKGLVHWAEGLDGVAEAIRTRADNPEASNAVPTGLVDLDRKLGGGLRPGELWIIAGRPAMGKSLVGMQIGIEAAKRGVGVAVFSLEMGQEQLCERAIVAEGRLDAGRVRTGDIEAATDWRRVVSANEDLRGLPLWIDDAPNQTVPEIRSKLRRLKTQHPDLGACIVDYLQLVSGTAGPKQSRQEVVSEVARSLYAVGKELGLRMVGLAQLNRGLEARSDKRPMVSDLRESGEIEQAANGIALLYRDEVYNEESADRGVMEVIIGKQRGGETGAVRVAFIGKQQRVDNLAGPTIAEEYGRGGYV